MTAHREQKRCRRLNKIIISFLSGNNGETRKRNYNFIPVLDGTGPLGPPTLPFFRYRAHRAREELRAKGPSSRHAIPSEAIETVAARPENRKKRAGNSFSYASLDARRACIAACHQQTAGNNSFSFCLVGYYK